MYDFADPGPSDVEGIESRPAWMPGQKVDEVRFCQELLQEHRIFRFERDQIITLRRLERLRVSGETVEDYCRVR